MDEAQARDMMVAHIEAAWQAFDWSLLTLTEKPRIAYPGRQFEPDVTKPYVRWNARHAGAPQKGFSDQPNGRRFEPFGLIMIQCLAPEVNGDGFEVAEKMAILARDAYRGARSDCITFTNCYIREIGSDNGWFIFNTYATFDYVEVA